MVQIKSFFFFFLLRVCELRSLAYRNEQVFLADTQFWFCLSLANFSLFYIMKTNTNKYNHEFNELGN